MLPPVSSVMDRTADFFNYVLPLVRVLFPGFNNQYSLFLHVSRADGKCSNATEFDTTGLLGQHLEVIRPDISPLDDNDILAA